jgi:hypothetical protein
MIYCVSARSARPQRQQGVNTRAVKGVRGEQVSATDFLRVDPNVLDHPKIVRLIARFRDAGFVSLYRLWAHAARFNPDGQFKNVSAAELGLIARISRQPEAFIQFLVDTRLLDLEGDTYSIHGWQKRQPFLATTEERAERNRQNAVARWSKSATRLTKDPKGNSSPEKKDPYQDWLATNLSPAFPPEGRCQNKSALAFLRKTKPSPIELKAYLQEVEDWKPVWAESGHFPGFHTFLTEGRYRETPAQRNGKKPASAVPPTAEQYYRGERDSS